MRKLLCALLALVLLVGVVRMAIPGVDVDVVINDVGYMLAEDATGKPAWMQIDPVQFASKIASGDLKYSDGSFESIWSQSNWYGGRGQDYFDDPARFRDSYQANTLVRNQIVIAPEQVRAPWAADAPEYRPSSYIGYPTIKRTVAPDYSPEGTDFRQVIPGHGLAQSFTPAYNMTVDYIWIKAQRSASVDAYRTLHLGIAANAAGTKPGSALAEATPSASVFPTTFGWVKIALSSSASLTANTVYHVYFYQESDFDAPPWASIEWRSSDGTAGYAGAASSASGITTSGTGTWTAGLSADLAFSLGGVDVDLSQSFLMPSSPATVECTQVQLLLRKVGNPSGNLTVVLAAADGNKLPTGDGLKSKTLALSSLNDTWTWHTITWDSAQTLNADTRYTILISQPSTNDKDNYVHWAASAGADGYGTETGGQRIGASDSGTWGAIPYDFAFAINAGQQSLGANVRAFAQYASALYVAGGGKLLRWQFAASQFSLVASTLATTVRQLQPYSPASGSNLLFLACETDDETDEELWVYDASKNTIRESANKARIFTTFLNRIYRASKNILYYSTSPGTDGNGTWTEVCKVGDGDCPINGLQVLDGQLYAGKWDGVYLVSDNQALRMLDFTSQRTYYNSEKMREWQGSLYIPVANGGLWRYNGNTMVAIGPDQDMGMPAGRQGPIRDMLPTMNALYCAMDGNQNYSAVLAYNNAGWHEIVRSPASGSRIMSVGFTPATGPWWLWFGIGDAVHYMEYSVNTDNPYLWDGASFNNYAYVDTPWFHAGLQEIQKSFRNVTVEGHGYSLEDNAKRYIEVHYAIDTETSRGAISFSKLGVIGESSTAETQILRFPSDAIGKKISLRFKLFTDTKGETPVMRSFALRYMPKPRPRYGWQLRIPCEDNLMLLNRAVCNTSGASLKAMLQSARASVAPISYFDRDGQGYMADITSLTFNMLRRGTNDIQYMANVSLVEADPTERTGESEGTTGEG